MGINERFDRPSPRLFQVLSKIGLGLAAAGGAVIAAPVALPLAVVTLGGYLTVAGTVLTAVSQATVSGEE